MHYLDQSYADFAPNLALDEALFLMAEAQAAQTPVAQTPVSGPEPDPSGLQNEAGVCWQNPGSILRVWEPQQVAVVVGRGSQVQQEVNVPFCQQHQIPIFRRHSGGASIVTGPGCLMYAVVIDYAQHPTLRDLTSAHRFVMNKIQAAVARLVSGVEVQGICDLTLDDRKCSGNSLKVGKHHFLYHGTLLYDFDLSLLQQCLLTPPRQPDYRAQRSHADFVCNLWSATPRHDRRPHQAPAGSNDPTACDNIPTNRLCFVQQLKESLQVTWKVAPGPPCVDDPASLETLVQQLTETKYSRDQWNLRR